MNPSKATCLSAMLNLYKVALYLAMAHSATQTRAQSIQTNAPSLCSCADKIADFANCIALLDTGHRVPVKQLGIFLKIQIEISYISI